MKTFGSRLREARKAKDITQKQLADKIGAKHNSISNWENDQNRPDPDTIELICGVLDIDPNYLLSKDITIINSNVLKNSESEFWYHSLIQKYKKLDDKGKHTVDTILEMEYNRCYKPHLLPFAAHANEGATETEIQHDLDIMDDDKF